MVTAELLDRPLTVADLRELPDDGMRYELIWGELYVSPSPSVRHQRLSRELVKLIDQQLSSQGLGEVFAAPLDVRLDQFNVVQPDIVVIATADEEIVSDEGIVGAPTICIEILSAGSRGRDNVKKRMLYATFGVPEYWIVDPEGPRITILLLQNGVYVEQTATETAVSSVIPALSISTGDL